MPRSARFSTLLILLLSFGASLHAQPGLTVFDVDPSGFPTIRAKMIAVGNDGRPLRGLRPEDISISENGTPRRVISLTCPPEKAPEPISIGLMVDSYRFIEIVRPGIKRMAGFLQMPPVEAGITTMDQGVYIVQDFTKKKDRLIGATDRLISSPGIHLQRIFYEANTGGVPFISGRSPRKILVLLTDLHCPVFDLDTNRFWKDAERENISVYTILLGANDYFGLFKRLADKTGGKLYERVTTEEQIGEILEWIAVKEQYGPCEVLWESGYDCERLRTVSVSIPRAEMQSSTTYLAPAQSVPLLLVHPQSIGFGGVVAGTTRDTTITLTAQIRAITVERIAGSDPAFSIISGTAPPRFTLQPGESRTLGVRYTSIDSSYGLCRFIITSDACASTEFFTSGGFPGYLPKQPTLKLLHPNGGEKFPVGDSAAITWTGILPTDTVKLEFSIDSGLTWKTIVERASGFAYRWSIPFTPSDRCLARVTQVKPSDTLVSIYSGNPIYDAAFSPDGTLLVTAGDGRNSALRLWSTVTGGPGLIFHEEGGGLSGVSFSPDGRYVATCSHGGYNTVRLYSTTPGSGVLLDTLTATTAHVEDLDFSPDGTRIVIAGDRSEVREIATHQLVTSFSGHGSRGFSAHFDPTGTRVVSGGSNGRTIVWDAKTGSILHTGTVGNDTVLCADFSPDGARIVEGNASGRLKVWDAETGTIAFDIQAISGAIWASHFSPDGRFIITGGADSCGSIWDAATGVLIKRFPKHNGPLNGGVQFSPDGGRIVTAGTDGVARIRSLTVPLSQQDTSDALWSIVAPRLEISTRNIDMGDELLHDSKDSLVTAVLCNRGTMPLHILGVDVTSGDSHDFMIMSGAGDFTLAPGECRDIVFTFMPMGLGRRQAGVTVRTTAETMTDTIHVFGNGIEPSLQVIPAPIDFGILEVGETKDTTVQLVLKNTGPVPITFSSSSQIGPDLTQFTVRAGADPFTLAPGEEHSLDLTFTPRFIGRTNGRIAFPYDGIGSPAVVTLFGQGIGGEVYVPNDSASPGDRITIPLLLTGPTRSLAKGDGTRFRAELRFDASILTPVDPAVRGTIEDGLQTVSLEGIWNGASDTLVAIPAIVGLGIAEQTEIEVTDFTWLDDKGEPALLDIDSRGGVFHLRGLCREGTTRLYNASGTLTLKPTRPSPARDAIEIDYETIEAGHTRLYLIDRLGRTVATITDNAVEPGRYMATFDASRLATGLYHCVLETPTARLSQSVVVIR